MFVAIEMKDGQEISKDLHTAANAQIILSNLGATREQLEALRAGEAVEFDEGCGYSTIVGCVG